MLFPILAPDGHIENNTMAAYLDRTLSPAQRADVDAHLAQCRFCRRWHLLTRDVLADLKKGSDDA